jgi:hypothetical protein
MWPGRPHDCICSLLSEGCHVASKLTSLPCLYKTFFCRSCRCFCRNFRPHSCLISGYQFLSLVFQIKFNRVWTCLNMSDKISDHVWSTVGRNTTKLIVSDRVWSSFRSCLIMFDQLSADILASLIKSFPRTTRTTTMQNVEPAVHFVYSRVKFLFFIFGGLSARQCIRLF